MSLILDALNRSDSERANPNAAPGLHAVHGTSPGRDLPFWRRAIWPGLVIVLAIIAVLPWLGDRSPAPAQQAALEKVPAQPAGAVELPAREPAAAPPAVEKPPAAADQVPTEAKVTGDVAALYESRPAKAIVPSTPAASGRAAAREPVKTAESAGADKTPAVDVDALARAAEAALVDRRGSTAAPVAEHEAPFIAELSQPVKDQIPSIFYSSHRWASKPSERSVVLNGQERRAGDQVKPGLRLVEILEDSIVLDFRGTEFRLRSLNSWVNL